MVFFWAKHMFFWGKTHVFLGQNTCFFGQNMGIDIFLMGGNGKGDDFSDEFGFWG